MQSRINQEMQIFFTPILYPPLSISHRQQWILPPLDSATPLPAICPSSQQCVCLSSLQWVPNYLSSSSLVRIPPPSGLLLVPSAYSSSQQRVLPSWQLGQRRRRRELPVQCCHPRLIDLSAQPAEARTRGGPSHTAGGGLSPVLDLVRSSGYRPSPDQSDTQTPATAPSSGGRPTDPPPDAAGDTSARDVTPNSPAIWCRLPRSQREAGPPQSPRRGARRRTAEGRGRGLDPAVLQPGGVMLKTAGRRISELLRRRTEEGLMSSGGEIIGVRKPNLAPYCSNHGVDEQ